MKAAQAKGHTDIHAPTREHGRATISFITVSQQYNTFTDASSALEAFHSKWCTSM